MNFWTRILCAWGWHKWSAWKKSKVAESKIARGLGIAPEYQQTRFCEWCNYHQVSGFMPERED